MNQKTKNILCSLGVGFLVLIGILLNHSSYDFAYYASPEIAYNEALQPGGPENVLGSYGFTIDFDGSVVYPMSIANDVRTVVIDVILVLLGGGLVWKILQKKNS